MEPHISESDIGHLRSRLAQPSPIGQVLEEDQRWVELINRMMTHPPRVADRELDSLGFRRLVPCKGDPIFGWLPSLSNRLVAAVLVAIFFIVLLPVPVAILEGNFINPSLEPDMLSDLGYWNSFAICLPAVVLTYGLYFRALPCAILRLVVNNAFVVSQADYNQFISAANAFYANMKVRVIPWIVGFIVLINGTLFYALGEKNSWHSPDSQPYGTIAGWMGIPLTFFLFYAIAALITRICATFFVLRQFFRLKANIQPLHPDGCGGLSPLGQLSTKLNFAVFALGIVTALGVISNSITWNLHLFHWTNQLMVAGYATGCTTIYFLPLLAAHQAMKRAKLDLLTLIHRRLEMANKNVIDEFKQGTGVKVADVEEIESIRKVYEMAREMPVYPFNVGIVSTFFGSIGVPVTIVLVEHLIARLN